MVSPEFWRGKRVLITGHTDFKGAWTCLWLKLLGARVSGYALEPPSTPNLSNLIGLEDKMFYLRGDIRDLDKLLSYMRSRQPEIVLHMAAQPLVRRSYREPVETYATNVMGTVNVLEGIRRTPSVKAAIIVTSDKCYENEGKTCGHCEDDPMGGFDPYSSSKGCAELITAAYRRSFFPAETPGGRQTAVASVRAGNVIGGGDWGEDHLIPDIVRATCQGKPVNIRNPEAVRPWQHVLDLLQGYLILAEKLYCDGPRHATSWNFGPMEAEDQPVRYIVERFIVLWGNDAHWQQDVDHHPHEAACLRLDSTVPGIYWAGGPD